MLALKKTSFLTLRGFLHGATTLQGPILTKPLKRSSLYLQKKSNLRGGFQLQEHNTGLPQKFCYKMFVFYLNIRLSGRISGINNQPDIRYLAKKVSGPTHISRNGIMHERYKKKLRMTAAIAVVQPPFQKAYKNKQIR